MNWVRRMVIPAAGVSVVNVVRRVVVGVAGIVVIALTMELVAPKAVRAVSNLFVTVTNTPNVNVVNTPSVNVASLPAVQVGSVSGNVAVTNALDNSNNPIPLVTQSQLNGSNAFDVNGTCKFDGSTTSCGFDIYDVPAGKIAVIQSVTGTCGLDSGTILTGVQQSYTTPSGLRVASFPVTQPTQQLTSSAFANFGGPLTGYAANVGIFGGPIDEDFFTTATQTSGNSCTAELAGYLVKQ